MATRIGEMLPQYPYYPSPEGQGFPGGVIPTAVDHQGPVRIQAGYPAQGRPPQQQNNNVQQQQQNRTLYVGNLPPNMQEMELQRVFAPYGQVEHVKIIKDKTTGQSKNYGFVRFGTQETAYAVLTRLNNQNVGGLEMKLNWATPGDINQQNYFQVFVGDLGQDVTDQVLLQAFRARAGNCADARVMWDHTTGRSKGYGFVSFRTQEEADHAISVMDDKGIGSRRVRCGRAVHKQEINQQIDYQTIDRADPTNSNVYIGNVSLDVGESDLRQAFEGYGTITEIRLHRKGTFAFVKFQKHEDACKAIVAMNGVELKGQNIKCSWGKNDLMQNPNNRMPSQIMGYPGMPMPALQQNAAMMGMPPMMQHPNMPAIPQIQHQTIPMAGISPQPGMGNQQAIMGPRSNIAIDPSAQLYQQPYGPYPYHG